MRTNTFYIIKTILSIAFGFFSSATILYAQNYTFTYTGAEQSFIVPNNTNTLLIQTWGAQGGDGDNPQSLGGRGGYAEGIVNVNPGEVFYVYVGGQGQTITDLSVGGGGFNGGGDARGGTTFGRGGGGGASDVRFGGNSLNDRIIVGGGGGGSATTGLVGGDGGGLVGEDGIGTGNSGGTQDQGGQSDPGNSCEDGQLGIGGSSHPNFTCAGGGGGWYGGASGAAAGGGSGYIGGVSNGSFTTGIRSGDGVVWITLDPAPDNDFCSTATPIYCGDIILGNTEGVGIDNPPNCGVDVGTSGGLWYSYLGTGDNVTFSTCNPGTDFNTQISIYTGLCDELICIDSDDNGAGCSEGSKITISTNAGTTYLILVNGAGTSEGDFELSVLCPPANDIPEDAFDISCNSTVSSNTTGANTTSGLPNCIVSNGTGGDLWYTFEGDGSCATLSTCSPNTTFDTQISVFSGTSDNLVCVNANNNDGSCPAGVLSSTIEISTLPDTDYFVRVHGTGSNEGAFELQMTCFTPPLIISCPADITLACNEEVPLAANNAAEFIAQGGPIEGGSCSPVLSDYEVSHEDLLEGDDCDGITIERVYTIENLITEAILFCSQEIEIPPSPDYSISCAPNVEVECAADIFVSESDVLVTSNCNLDYDVAIDGPLVENGDPNCPGTTHTYIYTVTFNGCGEQLSCSRTFTILDGGEPQITCPSDISVSCEDEIDLDPNDAVVSTSCDLGYTVYIKNPETWDIPGCNGTMYKYEYVVVDECGRRATCMQTVTIVNTPATIDVPTGGVVNCYEDIDISLGDATVNNICADFNFYLTSPDINGEPGCPGTTYTYTYRVVDVCENIIEEDVVFTIGDNDPPTIIAPLDITCECLAGINPNTDHAVVNTSCGSGYNVEVSGPQTTGALDCPGTQYIYTYTVTDACGRTASDIQTFTVQNGPPIFTSCPGNNWLQLNCEDFGGENGTIEVVDAWIASVEATTSCGLPLTVLNDFNPNDFETCMGNGFTTVTFTATDDCGRTTTCEGIIVVTDTEAPIIIQEAQDHYEICNYLTEDNFDDWVDEFAGAIADDECSGDNISWSTIPSNPSIECLGEMGTTSVTVSFVATDNCGNSAETTATFYALMNGGDFVEQDEEIPADESKDNVQLFQNQPNPFMEETKIQFDLKETQVGTLIIYNMNGQIVKTIESSFNKGFNEVSINKGDLGSIGLYYYRLIIGDVSITRSMILVE